MRRILIVDDEEHIRNSLRIVLEDAGYEIMLAGNGIEAEELLNENEIDLIITDMIMPGKDGLELIANIKTASPNIKIIAMTGGDRSGAEVENIISTELQLNYADMFGAQYMLKKPFDNKILLQHVADCFALEKATHELI